MAFGFVIPRQAGEILDPATIVDPFVIPGVVDAVADAVVHPFAGVVAAGVGRLLRVETAVNNDGGDGFEIAERKVGQKEEKGEQNSFFHVTKVLA